MTGHVANPRTYYQVFAALVGLTILTVAVSFVELGRLHATVALTIAVLKAMLVVLFFMHLWHSKPLVRLVAAAGFFWLAIMLALTFSDYASRDWVGAPVRGLPNASRLDKP